MKNEELRIGNPRNLEEEQNVAEMWAKTLEDIFEGKADEAAVYKTILDRYDALPESEKRDGIKDPLLRMVVNSLRRFATHQQHPSTLNTQHSTDQ